MAYAVHLLTIANIYVILAVSLDMLVGFTGLISLAHAAFFGMGAYATAILVRGDISPIIAIAIGMLSAAFLSTLAALPSLRVKGVYLLIVTIALQIVTTTVMLNWSDLTGGPGGIARIPPLTLFGHPIQGVSFLVLTTILSCVIFFICWRMMRSPFGLLLQAIRDDEVGSLMLGKNVALAKISVFALSGAFAALAGSLYAHHASYVDPTGFDVIVSTAILVMVMLGGAGTLYGPVLGAVVLTLLPEALRFMPAPPGVAAAARQLVYGFLLVVLIFFRPQGLLGKRKLNVKH
jgi:branched-chain amino acid transport system permease protein